MQAAAHTPGGYSGVPQSVGKEFVGADAKLSAAGIAYITGDGEILLLKRSDKGDHAGEWALPAGKVEDGETPEHAARRESVEEIGMLPHWSLAPIDRRTSSEGVDFSTFAQRVDKFDPRLNEENDEFGWHKLDALPEPLHPGLKALLTQDALGAFDAKEEMAFDRNTVRSYDGDGRLHVAKTHISKANVCEYRGSEIPNFEALGLDADKLYKLYRHPEELAKAAETFNNLPLLSRHVPVDARDHQPGLVIGSTGTDAEFNDGYLDNSMVVWSADDIQDIESEFKKELSSAYRYRADMTPGTTPDGEAYDGVMRDIKGNHVAVVKEGRAGPDVVVGDSMENIQMSKTPVKMTRKAASVLAVLNVHMKPKLAQDAKLDLVPILSKLTPANYAKSKAGIVSGIKKATTGILAQDATIDDVMGLLDGLEKIEVANGEDEMELDETEEEAMDNETGGGLADFLKGKLGEDDLKTALDMMKRGAADEEDEEDEDGKKDGKKPVTAEDVEKEVAERTKDMVSKGAMDSAIKTAVTQAKKDAQANARATRDAENFVRPWVGNLAMACDSADEVFKTALEMRGVTDLDKVHPSAYKALLQAQPLPGSDTSLRKNLPAMDAASDKSFFDRFPGAKNIKVSA